VPSAAPTAATGSVPPSDSPAEEQRVPRRPIGLRFAGGSADASCGGSPLPSSRKETPAMKHRLDLVELLGRPSSEVVDAIWIVVLIVLATLAFVRLT
jgi:hypothetical protein